MTMHPLLNPLIVSLMILTGFNHFTDFDLYINPSKEDKNSYSLLTYNTWGLPIWIPGSNQRVRYDLIPESLLAGNFDIICLQETFSKRLRTKINNKLSENYYHFSDYDCDKTIFGPVKRDCYGGLMTWSKYPIIHEEFHQYHKEGYNNIAEKIGSKGFLISTIALPDGIVTVINTHLYAGKDEEASRIRLEQLHYLKIFLEENIELHESPILLMGDLNINHPNVVAKTKILKNIDAYKFLSDKMAFIDSCPTLDEKHYTIDYRTNKYVEENNPLQKLDYILYKESKSTMIYPVYAASGMKSEQNLSDHHSWELIIKLRCKD